jgi:hypothetical protein
LTKDNEEDVKCIIRKPIGIEKLAKRIKGGINLDQNHNV